MRQRRCRDLDRRKGPQTRGVAGVSVRGTPWLRAACRCPGQPRRRHTGGKAGAARRTRVRPLCVACGGCVRASSLVFDSRRSGCARPPGRAATMPGSCGNSSHSRQARSRGAALQHTLRAADATEADRGTVSLSYRHTHHEHSRDFGVDPSPGHPSSSCQRCSPRRRPPSTSTRRQTSRSSARSPGQRGRPLRRRSSTGGSSLRSNRSSPHVG